MKATVQTVHRSYNKQTSCVYSVDNNDPKQKNIPKTYLHKQGYHLKH